MIGLYWFSRVIYDLMGGKHFIPLFIWGILAGNVAFIIGGNLIPGVGGIALGASGGVFAVMFGAVAIAPNYTFSLIFIGPVKIKYIALVYLFLSLIGLRGGNAGGDIAHLAGALIGFLYVRQLQMGNDWSKPVNSTLSFFQNLGGMSLSPKAQPTTASYSRPQATASRHATTNPSSNQIDDILDKISEHGYEKLTAEEKKVLFKASQK